MENIYIKLSIEEDAWNWWEACNKISHGVDWKQRVIPDLRKEIVGKNKNEAFDFLIPYLKNLYYNFDIDNYIKEIQNGFDCIKVKLFKRMVEVTGHPIYRENFTCFITSFPRFPYNYDNGYVWISNKRPLEYQLSIFIHELLHFQYFKYFGERIWDELGMEKHGELKEAMTVILNDEFAGITPVKDEGYEIHKELREKLLILWRQSRNMEKFIEDSIKLLK